MTETLKIEVDSELKDLIPTFLANRRKEVEELARALERRDFDAIRIIGHNMKGVGGGYGFNGITDLGLEVEDAARGQDTSGIHGCLERYRDYLGRLSVIFV